MAMMDSHTTSAQARAAFSLNGKRTDKLERSDCGILKFRSLMKMPISYSGSPQSKIPRQIFSVRPKFELHSRHPLFPTDRSRNRTRADFDRPALCGTYPDCPLL